MFLIFLTFSAVFYFDFIQPSIACLGFIASFEFLFNFRRISRNWKSRFFETIIALTEPLLRTIRAITIMVSVFNFACFEGQNFFFEGGSFDQEFLKSFFNDIGV